MAKGRVSPRPGVATAVLLAACIVLGEPSGPPANDDIAQAAWVRTIVRMRSDGAIVQASDGAYPASSFDFLNFSANGTNVLATMEEDEPSHGTHSSGIGAATYKQTAASVWWKWTSPINATMRLTTLGSTFDTALGIYVQVPWDGITVSNEFGVQVVGRADDVWWNEQLQSEADFVAHAGETYLIAVGGFRGATGLVTLIGYVESWIYPPVIIERVAMPAFELDLLGVAQDNTQSRHSKFVNISITCQTPGAQIFFTTDGLMPNVLPTVTQGFLPQDTTKRFTVPVRMGSFTIRAAAYHPTLRRSLLATSTAFELQASAPVIDPNGGIFDVVQEVRIFSVTDHESDPRAVIHYTLDGSEPELTSPLYAGGVMVRNVSNITVKARVWYPSEWREGEGGATEFVPGMLPSEVTASKPLTVKQRLPLPARPHITGESDPMVLKGGNPPLQDRAFVGSANVSLQISDPDAQVWFAFAQSLGAVESWTRYAGAFSVSEVGVHWIHVKGVRSGYTDSDPVSDYFEVLQRIRVVAPNEPFLDTVPPGAYRYYTLNLTKVHTDVTVTVKKFFGAVDIFLSARQRRPSLHNHSLSAVSMAAEGGEGGERLLALHTDRHLGMEVIAERKSACPLCPYSTPIVVGLHGAAITPTQVLVNIELQESPVVYLSHLYQGNVDIGSWKYFKLYLGQAPEPTRRGLVVRVWQRPPMFVGVRTALRQARVPTSSELGDTDVAHTMFGTAEGYYEFTMPVGTASREPWFVGVQGLVPVFGVETLNFTFAVSPQLERDAPYPGRSLPRSTLLPVDLDKSQVQEGGERYAEGDAEHLAYNVQVQDVVEDVSVQASTRIGRFAYFRTRVVKSLRWLEVRVSEEVYSGGLRIYAQQGVLPSLVSHRTRNVTTCAGGLSVAPAKMAEDEAGGVGGAGEYEEEGAEADAAGAEADLACVGTDTEGYFYRMPAYEGKEYYVGVYGFSYDFQSDMRLPQYDFTITVSTSPRVSGLGESNHEVISTNYRFVNKFSPSEAYSYFEIQHSDANMDLHIVTRIWMGKLDIVVSNTIKYPTRSLEGVGWKSFAAVEGGRRVNIHTFDEGFKPGLYYIGVYPHPTQLSDGSVITNADFGIASFVDQTSFRLEVGKTYRIRATTYSYRYFRFSVSNVYQKLTLTFREETSGEYITALFMQGEKPSDTLNLYRSDEPNEDGNIVIDHVKPELDQYYVMVHTYKLGYSGPVLQHTYTVDIKVDYYDPPGYKTQEHATEFQAIRNQRFEQAGLPRPPPWDTMRPSTSVKVPTLDLGRPQAASFGGETWLYYSVYVTTFSSKLTVTVRALTDDLSLTVVVRRAEKPSLVTYIDRDDVPDSNREYIVEALSPVTGGVYFIGIHASVINIQDARLVIIASVDPGIPMVPTVRTLANYFVSFDTVPALQYRYYKIYLPPDQRDLSIQVTHLVGQTDIIISNVDPWPTKFNYNGSQPGWWKSESAAGEGKEIVVHNYERGYKSPATYYIGIFAASFTSYFVLARLDRPPPTVPIGQVFRSQVAESAFATFRFRMDGLIVSRIVFMVRQQRPLSTGLALYSKASAVPTLLDYDIRTDISTVNGEYFIFIDQPRPDDTFYVGVFGVAAELLPRGENYYFLGKVMSNDEYEKYQSSPYLADPPLVPPLGNYVPPPVSSYTILPPDTTLSSQVLNNGSFQYFRLQVSEFTRVSIFARLPEHRFENYTHGPFFLLARRLHLPDRVEPPPFNSSEFDWFNVDVCSQLHNTTTESSTVVTTTTVLSLDGTVNVETTYKTRCYSSMNPSMTLSPFDNFANSSIWYVGIYAVGCRSMPACAPWTSFGSTVSLGMDCGCADDTPDQVEVVPFSVTADRVARLGLYGSLAVGHNSVKLRSPYDVEKYFIVEVNGSAAVRFVGSSAEGSFDLFVSDTIPYPQRAAMPPESLRSESRLGNPPVSITVLKPEGEISHVKVGLHSSATVTVNITITLSPPYYPLLFGRKYAGLLRQDAFSSTGQPQTFFRIDPAGHHGRRLVLRLKPTNTRCHDNMKNMSSSCASLSCCGGLNPFNGFQMSVYAETGARKGVDMTLIRPNADCIDIAACNVDASSPSGVAHCKDDCLQHTCCFEFSSYRLVVDTQLAPNWFVAIKGAATTQIGQRFTDSFELDIDVEMGITPGGTLNTPASTESLRQVMHESESMTDDADGPVTPEGHYAFQSTRRKGHLAGAVEEQPIIDIQDGETAEGHALLPFGKWRIYRFRTQRPGIVTVKLSQHSGSFGLRLLIQREALPTHDSFLTFATTDAGDAGSCTSTTAVGSSSCSRCTQDFCLCDEARGDQCTGKVSGSALTEAISDDPLDGATASIRAPVYPNEPLMIAVFGESEVFAPYPYSIVVHQAVEAYDQNAPCANVTAGQVITGQILARERVLFEAPPVPFGQDAKIQLDTPFSGTWGKCKWGSNDGTSCQYESTPEVYTGLSDRPYDATCSGCFVDKGWRYVGTPIKVRYFHIDNITYDVPGHRCFSNGAYYPRYNVTSKDSYPFYRTFTWRNTDPAVICDELGKFPWTVPWRTDKFVEAIKVETDDQCCDKCAREPTCNFWTVTNDDDCTQCEQQDISYEDTYVRPAEDVTFIQGTNETEWYESATVINIRGPTCFPAKKTRCCRLLSISETTMLQTKTPDAAVVSGSSGRCKPVNNGHVQLQAAQTVTCSNASASQVNDHLIIDTAEAVAEEAYLDDRQLFYRPDEARNLETCLHWWNGVSYRDPDRVSEPMTEEAEAALLAPVTPRCVKFSTKTVKLQAKDESNMDQCLVTVGAALPRRPEMRACVDTVYRMGNLSAADWKYFSVQHDRAGGIGAEWAYADSSLADGNLPLTYQRLVNENGGCLVVQDDLVTVMVDECAAALAAPKEIALQQWILNDLLVNEYSGSCFTGLLACEPSQRSWAGLCSTPPSEVRMLPCFKKGYSSTTAHVFAGGDSYASGQPVMLELTGILSSTFSLTYTLEQAPALIVADKDYQGVLLVAASASSAKFRFILSSPTLQGTAGLGFFMVVRQPVPMRHRLQITCTHRRVSNLPRQRPPGWDSAPSHVSDGPDANGVHVVPFSSAAVAGHFDFDIALPGNASLAGEEVPYELRVWSEESFKSDFRSLPADVLTGSSPFLSQSGAEIINDNPASAILVCAALTPGMPRTCDPRQAFRQSANDTEESEGWWALYYLHVGEPLSVAVSVSAAAESPGPAAAQPAPSLSSNCSAHVFVQQASASLGTPVNVTEILSLGVPRLTVNGSTESASSSLVLSTADGTDVNVAILFHGTTAPSCSATVLATYLSGDIIPVGQPLPMSFASPAQRFFKVRVDDAAFLIVTVTLNRGNALISLSPQTASLPTRQSSLAFNRQVDSWALGPSSGKAWSAISGFSEPFTCPSLVVSPEDDDFELGVWVLAIFTDGAANMSLLVDRAAFPPELQLFQDYSLQRQVATAFEWRVLYHATAALTVEVAYVEEGGQSAHDCPLSLFARYSLPPSRESWIAAAGREGGRSKMVVPSKGDQAVRHLLFSASRCPGGYTANGTHCILLSQCHTETAADFAVGGALHDLRHGPCAQINASAVLLPPPRACSFRFRLEASAGPGPTQ